MDNSMQGAAHVNHHTHVYDPALGHVNVDGQEQQRQQQEGSVSAPALGSDGSPTKRRPGRPKGSTKKNLLAGEVLAPKIKRPVGRPRKDGLPAGSIGPARVKKERAAQVVVS